MSEHENLSPIQYQGGQQGATALILDSDSMNKMQRIAEVMASSVATIPKHLQKNVGDCMAVVMQSMQWGMNPYAVAQKTHLVQGTLGYEAQLVNAVITSMAPTKDRLHYEWFGNWDKILGKFKEIISKTKTDEHGNASKYRVPAWNIEDENGLGVRVWATIKGEDEPRELTLLMTQARTRNSTLWADDPRQQLAYLAIKRWARLYTPDVIMGVYTKDELEDSKPMKQMGEVEQVFIDVDAAIDLINKTQTTEALQIAWQAWATKCADARDLPAHKAIKAAVNARLEELRAPVVDAEAEPAPAAEGAAS